MSLLTIVQNAADRAGATRPSSVASSTDPQVQRFFGYANKVGYDLMKKVAWQALRKELTFTGVAGETQTAFIPSDFDRFVPDTFWDRTGVRKVSGPVSGVEWQGLKATAYSDYVNPKFIYRGGLILILPALTGSESLAVEYIDLNWCATSGGTAKAAFTLDTDVPRIDAELITRGIVFEYLDGEGLPSAKALADYADYLKALVGNDQPMTPILAAGDIFGGGRHYAGPPASASGSTL